MNRPTHHQLQRSIAVAVVALALMAPGSRAQTEGSLRRTPYTPFALVNAAYNGRLMVEGVPCFGDLIADVLMDDIEAEDLVRAAIASGRLTEEALDDRRYLRAVQAGLDSLVDTDSVGD